MTKPTKVELTQGTPEWLNWRRDYIGGSEASVIMGVNRYTNVIELFQRKLGLIPEVQMNDAMARGHLLEPEARVLFALETGVSVQPACYNSPDYPFAAASMDGINIDGSFAVEIKCPGLRTHTEALSNNKVPLLYYPQLQHQMAVTGAEVNYYWSYVPLPHIKNVLIEQRPDPAYIERLMKREEIFASYVTRARYKLANGDPLTESDMPDLAMFGVPDAGTNRIETTRTDPKWLAIAQDYRDALVVFKDALAQLKMQEEAIASQMARKKQIHASGGGITVARELLDGEWSLKIQEDGN